MGCSELVIKKLIAAGMQLTAKNAAGETPEDKKAARLAGAQVPP